VLYAANLDAAGKLHLAWFTSLPTSEGTLHYRAATADQPGQTPTDVRLTFTLSPDESLTGLHLGLDQTHSYVFLTAMNAEYPDLEQIHLLTFPLGSPEEYTQSDLILPADFRPSDDLIPSELVIGRVDHRHHASQVAGLRWLNVAVGQHDILPLALTIRSEHGWRPGIAYFQRGVLLGFQVVADRPADASAPVLAIDPLGDLHLAWAGLSGTGATLFTATTGGQGLVSAPPQAPQELTESVRQGLTRFPLALVWLAVPIWFLWIMPPAHGLLVPAAILFQSLKLLWPPDLFARIPPVLTNIGADHFRPAFAMGITALLIALAATLLLWRAQAQRLPLWAAWLAYGLSDSFLTWVIFGANVTLFEP
jgi:hypothetical protein